LKKRRRLFDVRRFSYYVSAELRKYSYVSPQERLFNHSALLFKKYVSAFQNVMPIIK